MWLFSKMSTYPELGQIRNWQKNCTFDLWVWNDPRLYSGKDICVFKMEYLHLKKY